MPTRLLRPATVAIALLASGAAGAASAQAPLGVPRLDSPEAWQPFKTRVTLLSSDRASGSRLLGGQVLGDYYLAGPGTGLRFSGGLIFGPRSLLGTALAPTVPQPLGFSHRSLTGWADDQPTQQQPYLGLGYSLHSLKSGWTSSADLGLAVSGGGSLRWGSRSAFAQSLDDSVSRLQWTPVLVLGVSYRF